MAESPSSFLERIPKPARIAIYLALVFIAGYMLYTRLFDPLMRERGNLDVQIASLEPQVAQLEAQIRAHTPVSEEERAGWARTQARIEERIPLDYRLAELIEQISILAQKANLPDALISTSEKVAMERPPEADLLIPQAQAQGRSVQGQSGQEPPRRRAHITDIISAGYFPVTITFHGSFQNQGQFLADLAGLSQLIEVDTLEVTREYPETSFRIVLKAYHTGKVSRV